MKSIRGEIGERVGHATERERMSDRPAWFRGPGECVDCKGVPIYPGDLLRTFHYTGARRRKFYLYHVAAEMACERTGHWYIRMLPVAYLNPTQRRKGGDPMLSDELAAASEVIYGHGPQKFMCFTERPKRKASQ